jgi:hypothetical protein
MDEVLFGESESNALPEGVGSREVGGNRIIFLFLTGHPPPLYSPTPLLPYPSFVKFFLRRQTILD